MASETLAELTRNNLCERVLLRGLHEEDVARFIEGSAGIEPPPGLLELLKQAPAR